MDGPSTSSTVEEESARLAQYDDLVRFSRAVSTERTFDALIEFVAREAAVVMRADRSSVFLLDAEKDELWSRVALGIDNQEIRFPAGRGIAGYVVTTGELLNVSDPYSDPRFNPAIDRQTGYLTRSILCAPLKSRDGRVIGALQVLNKLSGGPFTHEDERIAETLAAQCAVAIENAQLYEQLRQAERRGAEPRTRTPIVLVANGDVGLVRSVERLLGDRFRLVRASDRREAVSKVRDEQPDLVLLSVQVDSPDGFQTCRALRECSEGRETPIIIVSTSRRPEDVIRAFEAGANDYIVAPFSPAQLRAKTHTWLLRTSSRGA